MSQKSLVGSPPSSEDHLFRVSAKVWERLLVFTQNLLHEGSLVRQGVKYTMRTEVMYRPNK